MKCAGAGGDLGAGGAWPEGVVCCAEFIHQPAHGEQDAISGSAFAGSFECTVHEWLRGQSSGARRVQQEIDLHTDRIGHSPYQSWLLAVRL
jgi:hypothetical protein